MNIIGALGLILQFSVVLATIATSGLAYAQDRKKTFVPGELLIGLKSPQAREEVVRELGELQSRGGLTTRSGAQTSALEIKSLDASSIRLKLNFVTNRGDPPSAQEELKLLEETSQALMHDSRVEFAHPNWVVKVRPQSLITLPQQQQLSPIRTKSQAVRPNDLIFARGLHWHYSPPPTGMNAMKAWQITKGSREVVVAVIDTGILPRHPDFRGETANLIPGYGFVSAENLRDANPVDTGDACEPGDYASWHGTHVAGTIGALSNNNWAVSGLNWEVSVLPVRALGKCGGNIADISDAIRWSAGINIPDVPDNSRPAHVINLSLGTEGECTPQNVGYLMRAIRMAKEAGVTLVVSAGNEAADISTTYPGGCPGVISVAASDAKGRLSPYSNFGNVTILAPGGDLNRAEAKKGFKDGVWSAVATSKRNPHGVAAYEGTSMAAPHVAGAIALAMSINSEWRRNPQAVEAALVQSAAKLRPSACRKPCGAGQLDAFALVNRALERRNSATSLPHIASPSALKDGGVGQQGQ